MYCTARNLRKAFFLVSRLDDKGFASIFSDGYYLFPEALVASFIDGNSQNAIFNGYRDDQLYKLSAPLRGDPDAAKSFMTLRKSRTLTQWHLDLNNLHHKSVIKMAKMVTGMNFSSFEQCDCEACFAGKATKDTHHISTNVPPNWET